MDGARGMSKNQKNQEHEKIILTNIKHEAKKQNFKIISNCIYKKIDGACGSWNF